MKEEKNYRIGLYRSAKNHRLIEGCMYRNVNKAGNECMYKVIRRRVWIFPPRALLTWLCQLIHGFVFIADSCTLFLERYYYY